MCMEQMQDDFCVSKSGKKNQHSYFLLTVISNSKIRELGLFLERAREPDALCFAPGHTSFAGREPGWLSQFWLDILYSRLSSLDDLLGHDGGVAK